MKRFLGLFSFCAFLFSGCFSGPSKHINPLQLKLLQTREYEQKKQIVFSSLVSVFQDLGYFIKNADERTGMISGEGPMSSNFLSKFFLGKSDRSQMKATGFIERVGQKTRVRLNFILSQTESSYYGRTDRRDQPIVDPKIYATAFERLEQAIFMRKNASL